MSYRIVFVGGKWDGLERQVQSLRDICTAEIPPINWLAESTDLLPSLNVQRWRPKLAEDGRPSIDDEGRYRYERVGI